MIPHRAAAAALVVLAAVTLAVGVAPAGAATPPPAPPSVPAAGTNLTSAQVRALAAEAAQDPAALARLRQARSVDGRPVDLSAALATKDPRQLAARLRVLVGVGTPPASLPKDGAAAARQAAGAVLAQHRFHAHEPPRPLRGVLRWIGKGLETVFGPVGRFFERLVPQNLWALLLASLLVVLALVLATIFTRRRSHAAVERHRRLAGLVADTVDPRELERRAVAAEHVGHFDEAVRLRFLAGLVRLDRAGIVQVRTSETTGQLRAALGDPTFDALARAFEEIVYGRRAASVDDASEARAGWDRLLHRERTPAGATS